MSTEKSKQFNQKRKFFHAVDDQYKTVENKLTKQKAQYIKYCLRKKYTRNKAIEQVLSVKSILNLYGRIISLIF